MPFLDLKSAELKLSLILAAIIGSRMLGLFLVLPVLVVLVREMPGYSPMLAGLAIGIYGLSQALLQRPMGQFSDRFGRRRILVLGLLLFVAGSVLSAFATHIWWLIGGRFLQGCGAVAGVALAFAADHVAVQRRPQAMALIGMSIGAAFLLAIVLSVPLSEAIGLRGLFLLTAVLGLAGVFLTTRTPSTDVPRVEGLHSAGEIPGIHRLGFSVFLLHAQLTAVFVVLPVMLVDRYDISLADHWAIYTPAMLISAAAVFPLLRRLRVGSLQNRAISWAFMGTALALLLLSGLPPEFWLWPVVALYFIAFNVLEAVMPSVVSQLGSDASRGRKMGIYTTWQFLGAFAGGTLGGLFLDLLGMTWTLVSVALPGIVWAWFAGRAKYPAVSA